MIRDEVPPAQFATEEQRRLYQIPHYGAAFETDRKTVFYQLKEYLLHTTAYAWIQSCDVNKDGRAAYLQWIDHYSTPGELAATNVPVQTRKTANRVPTNKSLHYK